MTPLKLSVAIRLGSMLHPQSSHELLTIRGGVIVGSCALGAAEQAGYVRSDNPIRVTCPACRVWLHGPLYNLVMHLNDDHRWTRERIADHVEVIENESANEPATLLQEA